MRSVVLMLSAIALLAAACGANSTVPDAAEGAPTFEADAGALIEEAIDGEGSGLEIDVADLIEDPQGAVDDLADSVVEQQNAQGGGSARLVVGDREWTFTSVLCAFGPDEIGQEGAEFVLSSIEDGLQMFVSVDSFGQFVSLNDIVDFANPSVDLGSQGSDFVKVDGKNVSAEVDFVDGVESEGTFNPDLIPGVFEATCP